MPVEHNKNKKLAKEWTNGWFYPIMMDKKETGLKYKEMKR